jgi:tetratricopeptide (TPR) repeat protein
MFLPSGIESVFHGMREIPASSARLLIIVLGYGISILLLRLGIFSPRHFRLRRRGLNLLLSGKPIEAEKCYRAALDLGAKVPGSDRVRLLVCLADSLIDQRRYEEAKQYLTVALDLGDPTGSGQGSMCELLLAQKADLEKATQMADEASRLHPDHSRVFGDRWAAASKDLHEAKTWGRKARALFMLDRRTEGRQALDRALRIVDMSKPEVERAKPKTSLLPTLVLGNRLRRMKHLTISATYWQIGLALLAARDTNKAAECFLVVRDTDIMGKYRSLAQEQLASLGYAGANPG